MKLSEDDGTEERRERRERRGGYGGGERRQVGQPMQILPEQRANQGGRQPLQRSGLPLVTGRGDVREGSERSGVRKQTAEEERKMREWGGKTEKGCILIAVIKKCRVFLESHLARGGDALSLPPLNSM